jgi:hypothetical protein
LAAVAHEDIKALAGGGDQLVEGPPDVDLVAEPWPGVEHCPICGDQNRHRLIGNSVEGEDLLLVVEAPLNLAGHEQLIGSSLGCGKVCLPGGGDEIDPIRVLDRKVVNDG